jgi:hypothetical protein
MISKRILKITPPMRNGKRGFYAAMNPALARLDPMDAVANATNPVNNEEISRSAANGWIDWLAVSIISF